MKISSWLGEGSGGGDDCGLVEAHCLVLLEDAGCTNFASSPLWRVAIAYRRSWHRHFVVVVVVQGQKKRRWPSFVWAWLSLFFPRFFGP